MKHLIMCILSLMGLFGCKGYEDLTVDEFEQMLLEDDTLQLVDVRTAEEYADGHLPGAINIDWRGGDFMEKATTLLGKDRTVMVYCRSGKRSAAAAARLDGAGFKTYNMLGGILAWKEAGKPVEIVKPEEYQSLNPDNMQRVRDFLHQTGHYFLATVDGDQPQVRPFGTAEIIEGKLYIQTGHIKNVAHQIAANPKIAICAFNGSEWLRITATLVEDSRVEIKKAMLDANPALRSMYNENDDNTAVFFLKDAKATISSFTAAPVEINF